LETNNYFARLGRPIVAKATAAGGPLAVIRCSGKDLSFLKSLISDEKFPVPGAFRLVKLLSRRNLERGFLDEALLLYFEAPHSFTGEDVVEFQCHGVPALVEEIVAEIVALGANEALPGEFSFRGMWHGKMTLAEAERLQTVFVLGDVRSSVASKLLGARSDVTEKLQQIFDGLITSLVSSRGRIEAAIDFPEAAEEQSRDLASAAKFLRRSEETLLTLETAYANFVGSAGEKTVAIVGEPNTGKSTLFNVLCGAKRALVSPMAGTTRDAVEGRLRLRSGEWVRLIDTAGLRELELTSDSEGHQKLEAEGIAVGLAIAEQANFLICVRRSGQLPAGSEEARLLKLSQPRAILFSHADLGKVRDANSFDFICEELLVREFIRTEIGRAFTQSNSEEEMPMLSNRQHLLLKSCATEIRSALLAVEGLLPLELAGENIRAAEFALRMARGENLNEDYIGEIFDQFCLGK